MGATYLLNISAIISISSCFSLTGEIPPPGCVFMARVCVGVSEYEMQKRQSEQTTTSETSAHN